MATELHLRYGSWLMSLISTSQENTDCLIVIKPLHILAIMARTFARLSFVALKVLVFHYYLRLDLPISIYVF